MGASPWHPQYTPAAMTLCGQCSYALFFVEESDMPTIISVVNNSKDIILFYGQVVGAGRLWWPTPIWNKFGLLVVSTQY